MLNFEWCPNCWKYHRSDRPRALGHYARAYRKEQEPNPGNFDGTTEELQHFISQRREALTRTAEGLS